jgi:hypothetical protein
VRQLILTAAPTKYKFAAQSCEKQENAIGKESVATENQQQQELTEEFACRSRCSLGPRPVSIISKDHR